MSTRTPRTRQIANIRNNDRELENGLAGLNWIELVIIIVLISNFHLVYKCGS